MHGTLGYSLEVFTEIAAERNEEERLRFDIALRSVL
jgi:hypothetical protein